MSIRLNKLKDERAKLQDRIAKQQQRLQSMDEEIKALECEEIYQICLTYGVDVEGLHQLIDNARRGILVPMEPASPGEAPEDQSVEEDTGEYPGEGGDFDEEASY